MPAHRCTQCGGALAPPESGQTGKPTGWFEPSPLQATTWIYSSTKAEPEDRESTSLHCKACDRSFHLFAAE